MLVSRSSLLDEEWYLRTYPQVRSEASDPYIHFLTVGWRAGNDPGPKFQTRWYLEQNPNVWAAGINPLLHYLRGGFAEGKLPADYAEGLSEIQAATGPASANCLKRAVRILKAFAFTVPKSHEAQLPAMPTVTRHVAGKVEKIPGHPTVLVCGHASGRYLYGAERSLLDLLAELGKLNVNVIATLPTQNLQYEKAVASLCSSVYVFPYPQWSKDFNEIETVVERFAKIIDQCSVDVVHVNTIMLREALTAAKRLNKRTVVHARELIACNRQLAGAIGLDANEIIEGVYAKADFILANSSVTAACYGNSERVFIVTNIVDLDVLDLPIAVEPGEVRIGMISSNARGKGVDDFLALAALCRDIVPDARFVVIGSISPEFSKNYVNQSPEYPNVSFTGYLESTAEALNQVDIVVNLSRVPESFGRTICEAMAGRRPVIAYDHGAMPELVEHGVTGFLVRPNDLRAIVDRLAFFCSQTETIKEFGERARTRAVDHFSREEGLRQLAQAYRTILRERLSVHR